MRNHVLLILAALLLTSCGSPTGTEGAPAGSTAAGVSAESGTPGGADTSPDASPDADAGTDTDIGAGDDKGTDTTGGTAAGAQPGTTAQPNWSLTLGEVQALLDQNRITYLGTYNCSMERVDVTLEDGTRLMFLNTTDESGAETAAQLMMVNERFNDNGFQENYLNQYDVTVGEEYYPSTASRLLVPEELWRYSQTDLSIARNEIFARHGRIFEDPFLNAVFSRKTWYKPLYDGEAFAKLNQDSLLNRYEKENLNRLIAMEEEQGYRKEAGENYETPTNLLSGSWLDLDGDGTKERVTYTTDLSEDGFVGSYEVAVNGQTLTGAGENLHPALSTASLDGAAIQLLACQDGPSDDPACDVYVYRDGKLASAGMIRGDDIRILPDRIYSRAQCGHFQSFQGKLQFEFKDDKVREVAKGFYEQGNEAVALAEIPLYTGKDGSAIGPTLVPGDRVIILGSDLNAWVYIEKKASGEKGWLRCDDPEDLSKCTLPDGTTAQSAELFDGLRFYG